MEQNMNLQFASALENIKEINESFSSGMLRVCYTGVNRNGSYISKQAIENAIETMYNCPVVCNYNVEQDTIGGHDMEIVETESGDLRLVNLTAAIGVIPMNAEHYWETVNDGGEDHEYFVTEAILWKRSPAYQKIAEDGVTSQSMEITVKNGFMKDSLFMIEDFFFTAFCLLGEDVTPCFESASLQMFNRSECKEQFVVMMNELKDSFSAIQPMLSDRQNNLEGGQTAMEEKNQLLIEFGLTEDDIDFDMAELSEDELREKFQAIIDARKEKEFALIGQFMEELQEALRAETVETCFGEMPRYCFTDCDMTLNEVYCYDMEDWKLYGFTYAQDGDTVVIDFESKKRKKFVIADFDEGEQASPFKSVFENATAAFKNHDDEWVEKYQSVNNQVTDLETELEGLKQYKADIEKAAADAALKAEQDSIFAKFEELGEIEEFIALRENCGDLTGEALEEKCFAIKGRYNVAAKFSTEPKAPRLPVIHIDAPSKEPYGGAFVEFNIGQ